MISMTGFGRGEATTDIGNIVVEAKTENHRFLDISLQLPNGLAAFEPQLNETIKKSLSRGKVRVTIALERTKKKAPGLDAALAGESLKSIEKIKKKLGIKQPTTLEHLLMIKEQFYTEEKPQISGKHLKGIKTALLEAIDKLNKMREAEGTKLRRDLQKRIAKLNKLLAKIIKKRQGFSNENTEKLKERIERYLEGVQIDEQRLLQEVAYLAERSDITEELVRLRAHIDKFTENFDKREPVGRELDFLLQEMNRESSTIAAKAKDAAISHYIVELKSEMERIKEQVQNIE